PRRLIARLIRVEADLRIRDRMHALDLTTRNRRTVRAMRSRTRGTNRGPEHTRHRRRCDRQDGHRKGQLHNREPRFTSRGVTRPDRYQADATRALASAMPPTRRHAPTTNHRYLDSQSTGHGSEPRTRLAPTPWPGRGSQRLRARIDPTGWSLNRGLEHLCQYV